MQDRCLLNDLIAKQLVMGMEWGVFFWMKASQSKYLKSKEDMGVEEQ